MFYFDQEEKRAMLNTLLVFTVSYLWQIALFQQVYTANPLMFWVGANVLLMQHTRAVMKDKPDPKNILVGALIAPVWVVIWAALNFYSKRQSR